MGSAILFTAARQQEIEDNSIVSGLVDIDGHLILYKHDGTPVDAGNVQAPNLADASDTVKGIVELATDAETITGTDAVRAVTPAGLASLTASYTRAGLVELATDAETNAGTGILRAVTPGNLRFLNAGGSIPAGDDLDTYIVTGQWHQSTNVNATLALHYPLATVGGVLIVEIAPGFISQTYNTRIVSGVIRSFVRTKYSTNAWSSWFEVTREPVISPAVIPSSVTVGSGSASVAADGTITFTGVSSLSMNNLFDGVGADIYNFYLVTTAMSVDSSNVLARFRRAGTDLSSSSYSSNYGGSNTGANWSGQTTIDSLSAAYFGYGRATGTLNAAAISFGVIARPNQTSPRKTLSSTVYNPQHLAGIMGNVATSSLAFDGLTLIPGSGTMTGFVKFVKVA